MSITYRDDIKDLPAGQVHRLFVAVGWSDGQESDDPAFIQKYFARPFTQSTLVISAWDGDKLVGAVRVLSDQMIRSVIYDLLVDPPYQGQGIGKELVRRCIQHYPNSEWLVQTTDKIYGYYKKLGFRVNKDVFLTRSCKYFADNTEEES